MSIITNSLTSIQTSYSIENLFNLKISIGDDYTNMIMTMHTKTFHTIEMRDTHMLLKEFLPGVLKSKCFNDKNLPFTKEVKNTELAHLFEHMLLEELCQLKIASGATEAMFAGRTSWNWEIEPRGVFHIILDTGSESSDILPQALEKTIYLFTMILEYHFSPTLFHDPFLYLFAQE